MICIIAPLERWVQHPCDNRKDCAMPETPSAIPLGPEGIDQAYPIVQTQLPVLTLQEWRHYAHGLVVAANPARGVMTAQHGGYIRGLFCHWMDRSLLHGDLLVVDNFAVMDLFGPVGAAQTLIEAMEAMAERHRCRAIHTLMPDHRPTPLHGQMQARGHQLTKVILCKALHP